MNIKIDKRVPFGFKGIWGKCYKLTNYNESVSNTNQSAVTDHIVYQRATYFDVGADIQFKLLEDGVDKSVNNTQTIENLVTKGEYRVVKTTDAHLNELNNYECICQPNDIILFQNQYWVVEKIDERSVYNPNKQTFYYLSLRKIFDEVLTGED